MARSNPKQTVLPDEVVRTMTDFLRPHLSRCPILTCEEISRAAHLLLSESIPPARLKEIRPFGHAVLKNFCATDDRVDPEHPLQCQRFQLSYPIDPLFSDQLVIQPDKPLMPEAAAAEACYFLQNHWHPQYVRTRQVPVPGVSEFEYVRQLHSYDPATDLYAVPENLKALASLHALYPPKGAPNGYWSFFQNRQLLGESHRVVSLYPMFRDPIGLMEALWRSEFAPELCGPHPTGPNAARGLLNMLALAGIDLGRIYLDWRIALYTTRLFLAYGMRLLTATSDEERFDLAHIIGSWTWLGREPIDGVPHYVAYRQLNGPMVLLSIGPRTIDQIRNAHNTAIHNSAVFMMV